MPDKRLTVGDFIKLAEDLLAVSKHISSTGAPPEVLQAVLRLQAHFEDTLAKLADVGVFINSRVK